jgi:hypothetical protein
LACPAQSGLQLIPLFFPTRVLGLRALFDGGALGLDAACHRVVLSFRLVQRGLRLVDGLLSAFALLLPGRLFPRPLASALRCSRS